MSDSANKSDCGVRASALLTPSVVERLRAALDTCLSLGSRLGVDRRAAVSTEYVIVVGTVGLVVVSAFLFIGPELVSGYQHARDVLAVPFP